MTRSEINVNLYTRNTTDKFEIQYQSPSEMFIQPIQYSRLSQWRQPDLIIICVKYLQLKELCQQLSDFKSYNKLNDTIPILIMMNGMGLLELVLSYFPENPIFQAITTHGAKFNHKLLLHTGCGETYIGGYQDKKYAECKSTLCELLNIYLPKTFKTSNIRQTLWQKLLINSVINPITTIHNIENGQITSNLAIKHESSLLCHELTPILPHLNTFEDSQQLFEQVCFVAKQTKNNISSMRQDHLNLRKSEIESITGYLLNKAKSLNIDLPLHREIYRKIKRLENHF